VILRDRIERIDGQGGVPFKGAVPGEVNSNTPCITSGEFVYFVAAFQNVRVNLSSGVIDVVS
jgi:hypothetical protein